MVYGITLQPTEPHWPQLECCLKEKRVYLFTFRERGKEGEREGEKMDVQEAPKNQNMNLAHNLDMYPNWKSNQ